MNVIFDFSCILQVFECLLTSLPAISCDLRSTMSNVEVNRYPHTSHTVRFHPNFIIFVLAHPVPQQCNYIGLSGSRTTWIPGTSHTWTALSTPPVEVSSPSSTTGLGSVVDSTNLCLEKDDITLSVRSLTSSLLRFSWCPPFWWSWWDSCAVIILLLITVFSSSVGLMVVVPVLPFLSIFGIYYYDARWTFSDAVPCVVV